MTQNLEGQNPTPKDIVRWRNISDPVLTFLILADVDREVFFQYRSPGHYPLNLIIDQDMVIQYKEHGYHEADLISVIESLLEPQSGDYALAFESAEPSGPSACFALGDTFALDLAVTVPAIQTPVDLYVLLELGGAYWSFPSWQPVTQGLDHLDLYPSAPGVQTVEIIPAFSLPALPPAGPLTFLAAAFTDGQLGPDHLVSNLAQYQFCLE